jgi:uncharacterized membrane protein (UPF0127 family)
VRGRAAALALLLVVAAGLLTWGVLATGSDGGPGAAAVRTCGDAAASGRRPLDGFGEVGFLVVAADGTEARGCALLAGTGESRATGMMGQRDLRGYDAMVFRFPEPSTGRFYMYRTLVPLSVAFLDASGEVLSTVDMEPCAAEDASACPRYGADAPFLHAMEVLAGGLEPLGIAPGARVTFDAEPAGAAGTTVTPPP